MAAASGIDTDSAWPHADRGRVSRGQLTVLSAKSAGPDTQTG
jgi:hypothetical protein